VASRTAAGVWAGIGFLWRVIPNLSLLGEVGFIYPEIEYPTGATTKDTDNALFLDILVGLRYHILKSGFWDPWIDAGVGWSRWSTAPNPADSGDQYYNAALVKVGAGLDLFLTQFIAVGLRLDAGIPIWLDTTGPSCVTDLCYSDPTAATGVVEVDRSDLPFWWGVGLNLTLYFMAI
jgi:hypothetical protein